LTLHGCRCNPAVENWALGDECNGHCGERAPTIPTDVSMRLDRWPSGVASPDGFAGFRGRDGFFEAPVEVVLGQPADECGIPPTPRHDGDGRLVGLHGRDPQPREGPPRSRTSRVRSRAGNHRLVGTRGEAQTRKGGEDREGRPAGGPGSVSFTPLQRCRHAASEAEFARRC